MIATLTTNTGLALTDLAGEIDHEHQAAQDAARTAVEHARRCGELLLQAKAAVGHGAFLPWLEANCRVKERQARNYMRITENWPLIANRHRGADLSVKGALRLLAAEKPAPPPVDWLAQVRGCNAKYGLSDELPQDVKLLGFGGDMIAEIQPCEKLPGYFYVGVARDVDTEAADIMYHKRGLIGWAVGYALGRFGFVLEGDWLRTELPTDPPWYIDLHKKRLAREQAQQNERPQKKVE